MATQTATFDPAGPMPVVELIMGGISYCKFHFLVQGPGSGKWVEIAQGDNKQSVRKTVLDPTIFPPHDPKVNAIKEMAGWKLGWSITFFGFSDNSAEPYDFTLRITQNDIDVLTPPITQTGSFDGPSKSFNGSCDLA